MDCRRVRKSLLEYSEGILPEGGREAVRAHLGECPDCFTLAEKLELSGLAIASLEDLRISEEASIRIMRSITPGETEKRTGRLLRSPRAIAVGAAVAMILVALAVVVGINVGGDEDVQDVSNGAVSEDLLKSVTPDIPGMSVPAIYSEEAEGRAMTAAERPEPLVMATSNEYDADSLRETVKDSDVTKAYAESLTMTDAITLEDTYMEMAVQEFVGMGEDGAVLEGMVSYITRGEPALLLCYVEKASYMGTDAWILAFAAPPRSGEEVYLSRLEIWVMDPVRFVESPDSSVLLFIEHR